MKFKGILSVILPLSFAVLLINSCSKGCSRYESGPLSVVVEPVKIQESSPMVTVPGTLIPSDRAEIKMPYAAKIAEVFVKKGDVVHKETPLFKLNEEELNVKINQLNAARRDAESLFEKNAYQLKNRDKLFEDGKLEKTQYDAIEIEYNSSASALNKIKADLEMLEYNLAHVQMISPSNGIIAESYASPTMLANENQLLFVIINTNPILVSFPLTADESTGISLGMPVSVKIEDLDGKEYSGSVNFISPEINQTGKTFDVWASIPNPDSVLKAGMFVTAQFTSTNTHKVFVVPDSAVITRNRDKYVFTVVHGIAHQNKVNIRNIINGVAEVSSGLAENDLIVAKGAQSLQDGVTVEMWRR
jgi:RND family efflux transporter MFP subunit